jgi:hypothetical protein
VELGCGPACGLGCARAAPPCQPTCARSHLLVVAGHVLCRDDHLRGKAAPWRGWKEGRAIEALQWELVPCLGWALLCQGCQSTPGELSAQAAGRGGTIAHLHLVRRDLQEARQLAQRLAILVLQHGDAPVCGRREPVVRHAFRHARRRSRPVGRQGGRWARCPVWSRASDGSARGHFPCRCGLLPSIQAYRGRRHIAAHLSPRPLLPAWARLLLPAWHPAGKGSEPARLLQLLPRAALRCATPSAWPETGLQARPGGCGARAALGLRGRAAPRTGARGADRRAEMYRDAPKNRKRCCGGGRSTRCDRRAGQLLGVLTSAPLAAGSSLGTLLLLGLSAGRSSAARFDILAVYEGVAATERNGMPRQRERLWSRAGGWAAGVGRHLVRSPRCGGLAMRLMRVAPDSLPAVQRHAGSAARTPRDDVDDFDNPGKRKRLVRGARARASTPPRGRGARSSAGAAWRAHARCRPA